MDIADNPCWNVDPQAPNSTKKVYQFPNKNSRDRHGNTSLIWVANNGLTELIYFLVERHGVPIDCQNFDGETALSVAVMGGHYDLIEYLISHGANVNIANLRGETSLHLASALGFTDIIKLLVDNGAFLEAEDECGETALHFAVREDFLEVVESLLVSGANPDHLNEDDESPSQLARMVSTQTIQKLFTMICNGGDEENAATVPDGNARGALTTSLDMRSSVDHKMKSAGSWKRDVIMVEVDEETDAGVVSSLNQSGTVQLAEASVECYSHKKTLTAGKGNYF